MVPPRREMLPRRARCRSSSLTAFLRPSPLMKAERGTKEKERERERGERSRCPAILRAPGGRDRGPLRSWINCDAKTRAVANGVIGVSVFSGAAFRGLRPLVFLFEGARERERGGGREGERKRGISYQRD